MAVGVGVLPSDSRGASIVIVRIAVGNVVGAWDVVVWKSSEIEKIVSAVCVAVFLGRLVQWLSNLKVRS